MDADSGEIKKERSAESICRLCFTEREHYRLIFIDAYSSLDEWIGNLTSLKIINVPGAPASLCLECQTTLQNFDSFREMCFTNDRVFKEMFTQNVHTSVSKTSEVKIEHTENQETIKLDSTVNLQVEATEITVEYQDIKIALNNTLSSEENSYNENDNQQKLEMERHKSTQSIAEILQIHQANMLHTVENSDCDNSPTVQLAENTETTKNYQDMKRKRDVDGKPPFAEKDDALTKTVNKVKHTRKFMRKHLPPFKCEICFKKFDVKHKYHKHIERHRTEKPHICSYCDKGFIKPFELNIHIRSHTLERPFKCKNCDKSFKTSSHLSRHKRFYCKINKSPHHNEKQILECEQCSKTFTAKWRFEAHIRGHTMEESNICSYCSKSFKDPAELKVHVGIHTREKSFKCNECNKTFHTSNLLMRHSESYCEVKKQLHDVQEKAYKCEKCDASFVTISQLMQHLRSHPGVKPYTCDVCQSKFSTSGSLLRHKRHTKRHTYTCEVCQMKFTLPEHLKRHKNEHLTTEAIL